VRYGIDGSLIDFGRETEVAMRDLATELIEIVDDVVDDLGSRAEVEHIARIAQQGTSADRQLAIYRHALESGATDREALFAVVDHLVAETAQGWQPA